MQEVLLPFACKEVQAAEGKVVIEVAVLEDQVMEE